MDTTLHAAAHQIGLTARLMRNPFVRIVLGIVMTFGWVPLTMVLAAHFVAKPYRMVWPQLLAAVLAWFGYRYWVQRVDKRAVTELARRAMPAQLGAGVLAGAGLVMATLAVLATLGAYRITGVNAVTLALLVPLAELVLVGLVEEMVFRGVVFGVTERALGSKIAIVLSALVFAAAHLPNDGVSVLAVAALCAFGVMQAALYMVTRSLWACIGLHIGWNYCLGTVFTAIVSGHAVKAGLVAGRMDGDPVLTGGAFGIEGSLVTVVLIGAIAVVLLRRACPNSSR